MDIANAFILIALFTGKGYADVAKASNFSKIEHTIILALCHMCFWIITLSYMLITRSRFCIKLKGKINV